MHCQNVRNPNDSERAEPVHFQKLRRKTGPRASGLCPPTITSLRTQLGASEPRPLTRQRQPSASTRAQTIIKTQDERDCYQYSFVSEFQKQSFQPQGPAHMVSRTAQADGLSLPHVELRSSHGALQAWRCPANFIRRAALRARRRRRIRLDR